MATKTKEKSEELLRVDLGSISSNVGQSRGMGVISTLTALGYGLFEAITPEQPPLWPALTAGSDTERLQAASLLAEHEPRIVQLWDKIAAEGQLQPIGVTINSDNTYNVVFGMRRCLAIAYGAAQDTKNEPVVLARLFEAQNETDLRFIAMTENEDRENESPIDKAMTYDWLRSKDGGNLEIKEICDRCKIHKQTLYVYLSLLDKRLEDKRLMIHAGEMSVDRAVKLLKRRKAGESDASDDSTATDDGRDRKRFPRVSTIAQIYEGQRPADLSDELWTLYCDPQVRKFLALNLGFKYKPFTQKMADAAAKAEKAREKEAADKEAAKAAAKTDKPAESNGSNGKVKTYAIPRAVADRLLLCLGKANAKTWTDEVVCEKLENIVNLGEPDFVLEDKSAQKYYTTFHREYSDGYKVKIKK